MIKRPLAVPDLFHQRQVLGSAGITFVVGEKIAITLLVLIGTATDHVHRQPSFAELVQRRQLPGRHRGCDKPWAVREHHPQTRGVVQHVGGNLVVVGPGRKAADQQTVETVGLGGVRHMFDVGLVDDRAAGLDGFCAAATAGMADEFEAHALLLKG